MPSVWRGKSPKGPSWLDKYAHTKHLLAVARVKLRRAATRGTADRGTTLVHVPGIAKYTFRCATIKIRSL
jgi:hypothetical protein